MKAFKRTVSVLLSLVLVLGMLTIGISVSAAETNTVTVTSNLGDNYKVNYTSTSETVTVTYNLQSKYRVVNVQGVITFDPKVLRFKSYDAPTLSTANLVLNRQKATQGRLPLNASSAQGLDYTTKDTFITVVFDIIGSGNTTVNMQYDVITANTASAAGTTSATDVELVNFSYINPDKTLFSTDAEPSVYPPAIPDVTIRDFLKSVALSLEGKIGVMFTFQIPDSCKGHNIKVVTTTEQLGEQEDILTDSNLVVTYFVYSTMMSDDITATVYVDGVAVGDYTYQVKKYINGIKTSSNTKLKNLLFAMANYGASAQLNFGYNASDLPNAGIDYAIVPVDANSIPDTREYNRDEVIAMGLSLNTALELKSDTAIRFTLSNATVITATTNGKPIDPIVSGTSKTFVVGDIMSNQLQNPVSITFTKGSQSTTLKWGVFDACKTYLNGTDEKMKTLASALYRYNEAAIAYFG